MLKFRTNPMSEKLLLFVNNPLILGSATIVFGSAFVNILNFLFNLFMTRNLSIEEYGIFASLVSFITLATLPAGAIVPTVVRFAASYFAQNELAKVRGLFLHVGKIAVLSGLSIFIILMLFLEQVANFFQIDNKYLIVIAGVCIFTGFLNVVNTALLQAKLAFRFMTIVNFFSSLLKLLFGVFFVFLGFGVMGAMVTFILSFLGSYLLSFLQLRFLFRKKLRIPKIDNKKLFSYGVPASIASFALTSFLTTDIILVKHLFSPESAGIYAGISLIGRIIFFVTAPIGTVMFPLIVQKHSKNQQYKNDFKLSLLLVALPSFVITACYYLFPEIILQISTTAKYSSYGYLLGPFGLYTTIFSLLTIVIHYFLSINKTFVYIPIIIAAILQVLFIALFHTSLLQVIFISLGLTSLLLVVLLLYYVKTHEKV